MFDLDDLNSAINWCNANQGFIMAVLTAVYVIATVCIAWLSHKNNANLKQLEKERVRPYIVCEFFFWAFHINFSISNNGLTLAKGVKLFFNPPLYRVGGQKESTIEFVENPIGSLAPGRKIEIYLGPFQDFEKKNPECKTECTVSYQSISGEKYEETFLLDVSYVKTNSSLQEKTINNVANSLDNIDKTLKQFASNYHKLYVLVKDKDRYEEELNQLVENGSKSNSKIIIHGNIQR